MRVQATQLGYYGDRRWRPGQVFTLKDSTHFSKKWMKPLDEVKNAKKKSKQEEPVEESESHSTGDQEVI